VKQADLTGLTVGELVERFAAMGAAQNKALLWDEYAEFSRLYWQMDEIRNELQERPGDQRRALMTLFNHADPQVRLKAGLATIDVTPDAAREVLQKLVDTRCYPQAADALATIWHLDGRPIVQR
jgi:cytochrome c oxidase assembly protein Cox11